ncbi:hypothetical protein KR009_009471 [Drosophila setifemur]|nr:hypothetical protein KR009_009471 [Drosophila setifemur]
MAIPEQNKLKLKPIAKAGAGDAPKVAVKKSQPKLHYSSSGELNMSLDSSLRHRRRTISLGSLGGNERSPGWGRMTRARGIRSLTRYSDDDEQPYPGLGWRFKVGMFLALVWVPMSLELCPVFELPTHWEQEDFLSFLKRRRIALSWAGDLCVVLIRSLLGAILPMLALLQMAHPNRIRLRVPRVDGFIRSVPIYLHIYWVCLIPYVCRLIASFWCFMGDTWIAYKHQVPLTLESINLLRVLIFVNHMLQLAFGMELIVLMLQGFQCIRKAYVVYKNLAGKDLDKMELHNVAQPKKLR